MTKRKSFSSILYGVAILGVLGFLYGVATDNHLVRMISKPLPVAVLLVLLKPDTRFKRLIYLGFLFSLVGDILLETADSLFVFGLVSFLTAHVFYISAFLKRKKDNALITAGVLVLFGGIYYWFLHPGLGEMAIPVLVYIAVILTMVWSSFAQRNHDAYAGYAVAGALFFMLSDSLIAYTKFYASLEYSRYVIILTYWLAQYLIFFTAMHEKTKTYS